MSVTLAELFGAVAFIGGLIAGNTQIWLCGLALIACSIMHRVASRHG